MKASHYHMQDIWCDIHSSLQFLLKMFLSERHVYYECSGAVRVENKCDFKSIPMAQGDPLVYRHINIINIILVFTGYVP